MFRVEKNSEYTKQVIVNFEDMVECNSDCIDSCVGLIESISLKFKNITEDCIDEPQDYYYTIECSNEEEADEVENFLYRAFEELEDEYCCQEY